MSLTWHIVKKDLRRMALPVGLWLVFIAGTAWWFRGLAVSAETVRRGDVQNWIQGLEALLGLSAGLQLVAGMILAAVLIQEDVVGGTTAHWQTRPIPGLRLLGAKAIAAGLLLVITPVVVLVPVWMACGFSATEWAGAAMEFAAWQCVATLVAMGFAALARNLGQFVFTLAVWLVAYVFLGVGVALRQMLVHSYVSSGATRTAVVLIFSLPLMVILVVLVRHYRTREAYRGWVFLIGLIPLALLIRLVWPWNWEMDRSLQPCAPVKVVKVIYPKEGPAKLVLKVPDGVKQGTLLAPRAGSFAMARHGTKPVLGNFYNAGLDGSWGTEAAMAVANHRPVEAPIWVLPFGMREPLAEGMSGGKIGMTGAVMSLMVVRPSIVCELPLQAGAEAQQGSNLTRMVSVESAYGNAGTVIVLEEREYWNKFRPNFGGYGARSARDNYQWDCFLLVNRRLGLTQPIPLEEVGALGLDSISIHVRSLKLEAPTRLVAGRREPIPGWEDGAVLVKVRFERVGERWARVGPKAVPVETEETNP